MTLKSMSNKQAMFQKLSGPVRGLSQTVMERLENQYSIILWILGMWMIVSWIMPIVVLETLNVILNNRRGSSVSMSQVESYIVITDDLFVFEAVITVIMILIILVLMVFFIHGKYLNRRPKQKIKCHETLFFKILALMVLTALMTAVSVSSVVYISCADATDLSSHIKRAQFFPSGVPEIAELRRVVSYGYEMATGKKPSITGWGGMLTDDTSLMTVDEDFTRLSFVSNASLANMIATKNVMIDGVTVSAMSAVAKKLYVAKTVGPRLELSHTRYPQDSHFVSNFSTAFNLAHENVDVREISMGHTLAHYILAKEGVSNPTVDQIAAKMGRPAFGPAASLAYILRSQTSLKHHYRLTGDASYLDLNVNRNLVHQCHHEAVATVIVFLVCLILTMLVILGTVIYKMKRVWSLAGSSQLMIESPEENEFLTQNDELQQKQEQEVVKWNQTTPMSENW